MALPIEIRLMIYDELLIHDVDLYRARCESCSSREGHSGIGMDSANPVSHAYLACTQILRTNKQICSEAIARLYSKNMICVKCKECEAWESSESWTCSVEPHRHLSTRYDHYYTHVRNIAIVYEIGIFKPYRLLNFFAIHWPSIDDTIILRYENTKHISLRLQSSDPSEITVDLTRRTCNPPTERVHDYERVLAQARVSNWNDKHSTLALVALADLEEICDDIILSHVRGDFRFTAFAVRSVRWRPSKTDTEETVVYLWCDKHATSDDFIKWIDAKDEIRYKARQRYMLWLFDRYRKSRQHG